LPDFKWLEDVLPQSEKWGQFSKKLIEISSSVKDAIDIGKLTKNKFFSHFKLSFLKLLIRRISTTIID